MPFEDKKEFIHSFWDDRPDLIEEEFEIWTPLQDGTPQYFKILDWENIRSKTFGKRTSEYIETDLGFLRIDSIRLQRELFKLLGFKGLIVIQRWVDQDNTRNTKYFLQKNSDAGELSKKVQTKLK